MEETEAAKERRSALPTLWIWRFFQRGTISLVEVDIFNETKRWMTAYLIRVYSGERVVTGANGLAVVRGGVAGIGGSWSDSLDTE